MAQWLKSLLPKDEDLSSDHQSSCKAWKSNVYVCNVNIPMVKQVVKTRVVQNLAYSVSVLSITFAQTSLLLYQSKASSQLLQKPCICFLKHITKHKDGHQVIQELCN